MRCRNYMTTLCTKTSVVDSNMAGSLGRLLATELVLFMTYQHEFCFFACSGRNKSASA